MIPTIEEALNGVWKVPNRASIKVYNPANGDVVGEVPLATQDDIDQSLRDADVAFRNWKESPSQVRSELLDRGANLLEEHLESIARLLTQEQGKPLCDSKKELRATIHTFRYYAEEALRIQGPAQYGESGNTFSIVLRQPIGPVVAIGPSNYPVELLAWKIAPALAAGCTVVVKPPSETPLAASAMVTCLAEAGAPPGVINLVVGPGSTVGKVLVTHPLTRKVAFTGSTKVGKLIAKLAGERLKPFTLELGGSAPFLVFSDANLDVAVRAALRRSTSNAGQICIAVNRIYVEKGLYDAFVDAFVAAARKLKVADGLEEPNADMGPLVSENACKHVEEHIADATAKGARIALGGKRLKDTKYEKGYFFAPTVLTGVNQEMKCMREETFGPVAPIASFSNEKEAIKLANDTTYGLAAYVYTNDLERAFRLAKGIEAGGLGVNVNDVTEFTMPFGGWKESGIGRELGPFGLESYLLTKHLRIAVK